MDSLPTNVSAFLPIEWFYIENNLRAFTDYDIGWDRIQFVITCISIFSISAAGFILVNLIRQKCIEIEFKKTFLEYRKVLISLQLSKKMLIISLFLTFVFLGIQNVRASDYRDITWEAEYIQEDMKNFQWHLIKANEKILEFDKLEARKVAASAAFGDISNKDKRITSIGLSLWSGNLSDLRNGVFEWVILWKKALKEMSFKGYVEPELIFDLTQKYKEVSLLGVQSSPNLARSYTIDFWRNDFITLVK
jgi:hypothetical protein